MNVVLHSARGIFYLLAANCIFGIITASFCSLIDDIGRFAVVIVRKRFISFNEYIGLDIKNRVSVIFIDLIICLLAASFMLLTSFVHNSGNFRLVSIPAFILGIALGKSILCRVIKWIFNRMLYCFKWIFDIAAFPILWFITIVIKLLLNTIKRIKISHRTKILTKYTERCFSRIKYEAKYGLLDDYYKELENERTV